MPNQIRAILSVLIITALVFSSGLLFGEQPAGAADGDEVTLPPRELPEKGNPRLDSQLNRLVSAQATRSAAGFARESNIELADGNVRVIIECLPDQVGAATRVAGDLGVVETSYRDLLQVTVPVSRLTALADTPGIRLVRLPWYPLPAAVSEGVALVNADDWQAAGYTGAGVKVGILDSGFTGYSSLLGTDLPASVTTQSFYSGSDIEGYTVHGTACAEIVYDMAPDADFYLVNCGTDVEFGNAVDWLINTADVDVISCSIGNPIWGPGDGSGTICGMVNNARAAGILWSQSAGNSAQRHWQGDFDDTDAEPDGLHNFSGDDESNAIYVNDGNTIIATLKWDDTWGASGNDYDLLLFDNSSPDPVAWSVNEQNGNDDPREGLSYTATYTGYYHLAIGKWSATRNVNFHLYSYYHDLQYQVAASSFTIPADSPDAMAVGAIDYSTPTTIEPFSSRGPTKDGRVKPDLVAPDGVTSATYNPFYGTSASAPHAAGAAVLVKERYPSYSPAQIQSFLEGRAVDLGAAGKDNTFGSGRLDLGLPPPLTPPSVATNTANTITTGSATLNGSLTSLGEYSSANVSFEWGTVSGALDQETNPQEMGSTGAFSASLSSLAPSTTYYFRAKAASSDAVSGDITVYGTELSFTTLKALVSIGVTPDSPTIALGRSRQFTATGTYSDASTDNLTASVDWSSGNTTVARINAAGLAISYAEGTANITAASGGISGNTTLTVGPRVLDSVQVSPDNPTVIFYPDDPPTIDFWASAYYSDGIPAIILAGDNWTSDNTSVATIEATTGLATTVSAGTTVINVTYSGKTDNTTLTVLPDTVAPVVTLTSPTEGQIFSGNTANVSGTVDDLAATAHVIVNGGAPFALTLGASGNFTRSVNLNTGSNTILVRAVDSTGNTGTSGTVTVVVNPNKPGIIIAEPAPGTITTNSSITVTGAVSGNVTTASLILNSVSQAVPVASGNFSANVTLTEGINILAVNACDAGHAGDSDYLGTSGTRMVTLDTAAPVVTIESPISGHVLNTPAWPQVRGWVDDPGVNTVDMMFNSIPGQAEVFGGHFSLGIVGATLVSGNNTVTVTATDAVGNTANTSVTILYDNTRPRVTVSSPSNKSLTDAAIQTVTGIISDASITTATLYVNGTPRAISVANGSFSENVTLATGANTLEVRASDTATPPNTGTSGVLSVTLDNTPPAVAIGLSDPTDSITLTVASNEALAAAPTASVNSTVTMTPTGINKWSGTYGCVAEPIADGACTVTVSGMDRAGNTATGTATFCKQTVTISDNETATLSTSTTTLQISTTANVTDASVSFTQHLHNPSGNVGNPEGAEKVAGAFVEIVASPELRDNLEQIYIMVDYDPAELPAGTDESTLKLYLWDVTSGTWQVVAGSGVNTDEDYIYGTVTHLSKYGGFGTVPAPPSPPPPPTGNGGGGGSPAGVTSVAEHVVPHTGEFLRDVTICGGWAFVTLTIPKGTIGKTGDGYALRSITILEYTDKDESLEPPEHASFIGEIYKLGPYGATFDPPITVTFRYETKMIPEGTNAKNLVIGTWDSDAQQWIELESDVDPEEKTIMAKTSHFSPFVILLRPQPATFTVADLSATPEEVDIGQSVNISVLITNTGDITGSYEVNLKIDNVVAQTKEVTLDGGDSKTISFSVTPDTVGKHTVSIGDLPGTFEAKAPEAPPVSQPPPVPAVVPAPASFAISDLSVTPSEVNLTEPVTISAMVTNTGGSEGSYTVVLKIDGAEEVKKEVALGAGKSETVTFTVVNDTEGSHAVDVNGKVGQFTVIAPPPSTPTPAAALPVQPPTKWPLIGGIIAGCVVVIAGLMVYFFVWRKRSTPLPP